MTEIALYRMLVEAGLLPDEPYASLTTEQRMAVERMATRLEDWFCSELFARSPWRDP